MSVTEQIFARLLAEETYSVVTKPAALFAMLSLLSGALPAPTVIPHKIPYIKAIEVSDSYSQVCRTTEWGTTEKREYRPKTALGERLMALRNKAIAKGIILLDRNEIDEEVRRRRGEIA